MLTTQFSRALTRRNTASAPLLMTITPYELSTVDTLCVISHKKMAKICLPRPCLPHDSSTGERFILCSGGKSVRAPGASPGTAMSDSQKPLILTDEDIRRSGYIVDPFDAGGRYVGAPLVRVLLKHLSQKAFNTLLASARAGAVGRAHPLIERAARPPSSPRPSRRVSRATF